MDYLRRLTTHIDFIADTPFGSPNLSAQDINILAGRYILSSNFYRFSRILPYQVEPMEMIGKETIIEAYGKFHCLAIMKKIIQRYYPTHPILSTKLNNTEYWDQFMDPDDKKKQKQLKMKILSCSTSNALPGSLSDNVDMEITSIVYYLDNTIRIQPSKQKMYWALPDWWVRYVFDAPSYYEKYVDKVLTKLDPSSTKALDYITPQNWTIHMLKVLAVKNQKIFKVLGPDILTSDVLIELTSKMPRLIDHLQPNVLTIELLISAYTKWNYLVQFLSRPDLIIQLIYKFPANIDVIIKKLKAFPSILVQILKEFPGSFNSISKVIPDKTRFGIAIIGELDESMIMELIKAHTELIQWIKPDWFSDDKIMGILALSPPLAKHFPLHRFTQYLCTRAYVSDETVGKHIIYHHPTTTEFFPKKLWANSSFILEAAKVNPAILSNVPTALLTKNLIAQLVEMNPDNILHIPANMGGKALNW